jgi:hypothetical protein
VGVWEEHTGGQGKARRLFDQPEPAAQSDEGEHGGAAEVAAAVAALPESGNAPSSARRPSPSHRDSVPHETGRFVPSDPDREPKLAAASYRDSEPIAPQPSALSIADADPPPASPDAIQPTASTAGTPVPAPATPTPPDAASVARAWLSKQGAAGQALIALGDAIHARALQREHVVHRDEGCLLAYPEALTDLTIDGCVPEPQALRQALWDAKLIAVDPMRPFLKSRNIEGRVWIVLVPQAGAALSDLLAEDAGGTCDVARSASDPKPAPAEQESRSVADTEADQARPRAAPQAPVSRSAFDAEPRPIGASRSPRAAS